MGRTLHWSIKPKEKAAFNITDLKKIYDIGKRVKDSNNWTCETFNLDPDVYPNWKGLNDVDCEKGWAIVDKRWQELAQQGKHPVEIEIQLVKEGICLFQDNQYRRKMQGFCKVGGNEQNACAIIVGLTVVSIEVDCTITVNDEGQFLKCPIVIEKGKARPDNDRICSQLAHLLGSPKFNSSYSGLAEEFEKLAKELWEMREEYRSRYYPPQCEWSVQTFCRQVNAKDFEEHPEYSGSQIMAGFYGEYYGLNGEHDPEKESYNMAAMVKAMLPKGCTMEVAPKLFK